MKLGVITVVALLSSAAVGSTALAQSVIATQARPTDQELASAIATRIANDKTFTPDAVKVKVEGGVVTLSGMVPKDADKLRAERVARVEGVVRVDNKLVSREKATDKVEGTAGAVADATEKGAKKTAKATKTAVSKTGEAITDTWITSRIKTSFMGEEALRASDIQVSTDDHVVTLTGAVPSVAARTMAIAKAKDVEGVSRVVDKLKVVDLPK